MHYPDFLPTRDVELKFFANRFSTGLSAAAADYDIPQAEADHLAQLAAIFEAAYHSATTPLTRTSVVIVGKNRARSELARALRSISRRVQANPNILPVRKRELGLPTPADHRTPQPPPRTRPVLSLMSIWAQTLKIHLRDEATLSRRAKPFGIEGAEIYTHIGPVPPTLCSAWTYKGLARRSVFIIPFAPGERGQVAHIRALWKNTRGVNGPWSNPIAGMVAG